MQTNHLFWFLHSSKGKRVFKSASLCLKGRRLWVHPRYRFWDWSLFPWENNSQSSAVFHWRGPGGRRECECSPLTHLLSLTLILTFLFYFSLHVNLLVLCSLMRRSWRRETKRWVEPLCLIQTRRISRHIPVGHTLTADLHLSSQEQDEGDEDDEDEGDVDTNVSII